MKRRIHLSQSVQGALRNWPEEHWKVFADMNKMTVEEAKYWFLARDAEGKRVVPVGDPCENFSFLTGCPGHPVPEGEECDKI